MLFRRMLKKLMQLKRITKGGLGAKPPVVGCFFFDFLAKNSDFSAIWITFSRF